MSDALIRRPAVLDAGEYAGRPIVAEIACRPQGNGRRTRVYVPIFRRRLRALWRVVPSLYLWVRLRDKRDGIVVTAINAAIHDLPVLDGAVLGSVET